MAYITGESSTHYGYMKTTGTDMSQYMKLMGGYEFPGSYVRPIRRAERQN